MKKHTLTRVFLLTFLILAVACMAVALSLYSHADGGEQAEAEVLPTISTGNVEVLRGKYFEVNVILSDNTLGLTSLDLFLNYDPTVMTLVKYDTTKANGFVKRGSALSSLGLTTSDFNSSVGMAVRPVQFLWNGTDADYSNGTILTLKFKSISSSDPNLLGKHYFSLSYRAENTFRTTPKAEGGQIIYQEVNLDPGFVEVTAGKFQCTYFDHDGREIIHYEENDFSLFVPEEPEHPSRASTRTHYFTYEEDQWSTKNPWTPEMEEPESIHWEITAEYTAHAQPYTVYYYFGEKDPETGVLDIAESSDYYYIAPIASAYGAEIFHPAKYVEDYYSVSDWCVDSNCTTVLDVGLIPEDTSVNAASVAASPRGVPLENTFTLKLYAYKQFNEDVIAPEQVDVLTSKIVNTVTVDGTTVNVAVDLTKNFGIMSMALTLDFDNTYLTLTGVSDINSEIGSSATFWTTNEQTPAGYAITPYILCWQNLRGNFYDTGRIVDLTFTLDPNAPAGSYAITFVYETNKDVTRYYDETQIGEGDSPNPAMLWYTNLNIVAGEVIVREVEKPTAHEGTYTFNKEEQTYTFATEGGAADYLITEGTDKRTLHGDQEVEVCLKTGDNVYRFWEADSGRPRGNLTFPFEILKRSVAKPVAATLPYYYDHSAQTYSFSDWGGVGYYTASGNFTRTLVGTEEITVSLDHPLESYWGEDEEDVASFKVVFEILRLRVAKPVSADLTYTYDTKEQTYSFTSLGDSAYHTMTENSNKRTASGSQNVVFTLNDLNNYCWNELGDPTEPATYSFVILPRAITAPTATTVSYTYNGSVQTYLFGSETQDDAELYYSVSGNKRTAADTYIVTVELLHKADTYWADTSATVNKTFEFVIAKKEVIAPAASVQTLTYNKENQTYLFKAEAGDTTLYTVDTAAMTKSASGTTPIVVALKDKGNYCWNDLTYSTDNTDPSADLSYPFTIHKKAVTVPTPNTAFTESYVYQEGKTHTFTLQNIDDQKYYEVTHNKRSAAGTYNDPETEGKEPVTITLTNPEHTYWLGSDPESNAPITYAFVIAKAQVRKPSKYSGVYTYSGEEITYEFGYEWEPSRYTVSNNKRTDAGYQQVTVTLKDKSNYAWKPNGEESVSSNDLKYDFNVERQKVAVPGNKKVNGSDKKYTFTGSAVQAEFDRVLRTDLYVVANDSRIYARTYNDLETEGYEPITFTLKDTANYCWSDGTDGVKTLTFKIEKKTVKAPTGPATTEVTYNGENQSYQFWTEGEGKDVYYTCSEVSFKDADTYTVTCALVYKSDCIWDSGDSDDKTFTFVIKKKVVDVPAYAQYNYDGNEHTSGLETNVFYTVSEDQDTHISSGLYTATLTLKDETNTAWSDSSILTADYTYQYRIIGADDNCFTVGPNYGGWTYGDDKFAFSATSKYGTVEISYRLPETSVFIDELPEVPDAGLYQVKFSVAETVDWNGLEASYSFTIDKAVLDMSEVAWDYTAPFTFNGEAHTVAVAVTSLPELFTTNPEVFKANYTNNSKIDRGDYTATVTFSYDATNYLPDYGESTFVPSCDYKINPKEVAVVWEKADSYVFTGETLTIPSAYFIGVAGKVDLEPTEVSEKPFLASGDYTFHVDLLNDNYLAKTDTDSTNITVLKKAIPVPTAHDDVAAPYVYSGSEQTYAFAAGFDGSWMTVAGNTRTDAGSQTVTVSLKDLFNTYWEDTEESVEPLSDYLFTINKAVVPAPTETVLTYVYNGAERTYTFGAGVISDLYEVKNDKRTVWGSQTVTVKLLYPENYKWNSVVNAVDPTDLSGDLAFTFTIEKLGVTPPTKDATSYVYNGEERTYTLGSAVDSAYYTVSGNKRTDAGSQTVTVKLSDKNNTYWKGADPDEEPLNLTFTFEIAKAEATAPTADANSYTFDGKVKNFVYENAGDSALYSESGVKSKIDSGSNVITVSLKNENNYRWKGTDSSAAIKFTFTVERLEVCRPNETTESYVYNGASQTYAFDSLGDSEWYTVSNDKRTNAGNYTGIDAVTVTLKDKKNTFWKDAEEGEETADLTFDFVIAKKEAVPPTATTQTYVYTGAEQSYVFAALGDSSLYATNATSMTNAGTTEITVSLVSPLNYRWKGTDSSAALIYPFVIEPAKVEKPAKDETVFLCNGGEQTYYIAKNVAYAVSGETKSEAGTSDVVITLKPNYAWADGTTTELRYEFTISHDYKNHYTLAAYKASDADCTHSATYYLVCDCGAVGTETYEVGDPLGHLYEVEFEWQKRTSADGIDTYTGAVAHVTCARAGCAYDERMPAELNVEYTAPGTANGLKKYVASIELDRTYTDTREVILPAVYHNYGDPEWTWSVDDDGNVVAKALFTCSDEGFEHITEEEDAVVTIADKDEDTFVYVGTVTFNGVEYTDRNEKEKPTLTFYTDEISSVAMKVLPGTDVTDLIPAVPTKEGEVFLKWLSKEGITLTYSNGAYTGFVMRDADRTFYAIWKKIGSITVSVNDKEDNSFVGCNVELKQGDTILETLTTDESGTVSFSDLDYGNYSIVVTYTDGTSVTYTTGAVLSDEEKDVYVVMSEKRFNTEVKDDDNKNISVENLENSVPEEDKEKIVTTGQEGDVAEITVVLSVVNETDDAVVAEMTEAIQKENKEVVDLSDITLIKTVKVVNADGEEVSTDSALDTSDSLVDITFPLTDEIYAALAKVHGSVENIVVARKEGEGVSYLTKCDESVALAGDTECFYVAEQDGVPYIVIRTSTFSTTYGLCVNGSPQPKTNEMLTFVTTDWTYGETAVPATATSLYGDPVIEYRANATEDWSTTVPTAAGTYQVRAMVAQTEEYSGLLEYATLTIAKANYNAAITFEDVTVVYDGEVHSIVATGMPEGVTVNYENNGQVDVGTYEIKAYFVGDPNYETIPSMTATLTILEEKVESSKECCIFFWILLAIAILEIILLILLFLQSRKYKKRLGKEKERKDAIAMSALWVCALGKKGCLILNISLLVLDIALLGVIIWRFLLNRKDKKALEELKEENAKTEDSNDKAENDSGAEDSAEN